MKTDAAIRTDVEGALRLDPSIDERNITIRVEEGVVTLGGSVAHYADRWTAEDITKRVTGVRAIANDIDVHMPKPGERSDTEIATAALNSLKWHFSMESTDVKVVVKQGWITLSGTVEYGYQRTVAESAVRYLMGVKGLTNNLVVVAKAEPSDVKHKIESAFQRQAALDAKGIQVKVTDSSVVLEGNVHSLREKDDAAVAAWSAPGVTRVDNRLQVSY